MAFYGKLLLWDIDGTLIDGDHVGEHSMELALEETLGRPQSMKNVEWYGMTDRAIATMLFRKFRIPSGGGAEDKFLVSYLRNLIAQVEKNDVKPQPGVVEILRKAGAHSGFAQWLLTGNLEQGAEIKLAGAGLRDHFERGIFADFSADRNELSPRALTLARLHLNVNIHPDNIYVIGDTPKDIQCGKIIGAKTLAVATGSYSFDDLESCKPTITFKSLEDVDAVMAFLEK